MTTQEKTVKKQTGVRLSPELIKQLKYLALDQDRSLTDIFEEAAKDIILKYKPKK
jgi:predicted DNA-binding protein